MSYDPMAEDAVAACHDLAGRARFIHLRQLPANRHDQNQADGDQVHLVPEELAEVFARGVLHQLRKPRGDHPEEADHEPWAGITRDLRDGLQPHAETEQPEIDNENGSGEQGEEEAQLEEAAAARGEAGPPPEPIEGTALGEREPQRLHSRRHGYCVKTTETNPMMPRRPISVAMTAASE